MQQLVAGVDSSTQSCKVVIRDLHTGKLVRSGAARHRRGTEIDPQVWRSAFDEAVRQAGGLDDVVALSVAGQQHGMVALDSVARWCAMRFCGMIRVLLAMRWILFRSSATVMSEKASANGLIGRAVCLLLR